MNTTETLSHSSHSFQFSNHLSLLIHLMLQKFNMYNTLKRRKGTQQGGWLLKIVKGFYLYWFLMQNSRSHWNFLLKINNACIQHKNQSLQQEFNEFLTHSSSLIALKGMQQVRKQASSSLILFSIKEWVNKRQKFH
jgi:hypothetical protein